MARFEDRGDKVVNFRSADVRDDARNQGTWKIGRVEVQVRTERLGARVAGSDSAHHDAGPNVCCGAKSTKGK